MYANPTPRYLSGQPRYSVSQSLHGIELQSLKKQPLVAGLICHCSNFHAALRIAKQAAHIRQQPLILDIQFIEHPETYISC